MAKLWCGGAAIGACRGRGNKGRWGGDGGPAAVPLAGWAAAPVLCRLWGVCACVCVVVGAVSQQRAAIGMGNGSEDGEASVGGRVQAGRQTGRQQSVRGGAGQREQVADGSN